MANNGSSVKKQRGTVLKADWAGDDYWEPDRQMIKILDRLGFKWEFVQFSADELPSLTPYGERGNKIGTGQPNAAGAGMAQVRAHTHEDIVASYEATLRRAERLPTTTWDFSLNGIDAHHRYLAAIAAGIPHFVIIRLRDTLDLVDREYIAIIRNLSHGLRVTPAETMASALKVVSFKGLAVEDVAREYNVPPSSLRRAIEDQQAQERARSLKVEVPFAKLGKGIRTELATLNDAPFTELTKLFGLTQPTGVKAADIIKEVKAQSSDKKALEVIKRVKEVDLAPNAAIRGNTAKAGITAGPLSVAEAYRLSPALKAFEVLMSNTRIVDALLRASVTDPSFPKVNNLLAKIKPNFDKLCKHYGV